MKTLHLVGLTKAGMSQKWFLQEIDEGSLIHRYAKLLPLNLLNVFYHQTRMFYSITLNPNILY